MPRVETQQFLFAGVAVVLGTHEENGTVEACGIDHRQVDSHVEIGAAGHAVAELKLERGEGIDQGGFSLAADIAVENVLDLGPAERAARVGPVEIRLLAPTLDLRAFSPV